jgi:hypothetical protein
MSKELLEKIRTWEESLVEANPKQAAKITKKIVKYKTLYAMSLNNPTQE